MAGILHSGPETPKLQQALNRIRSEWKQCWGVGGGGIGEAPEGCSGSPWTKSALSAKVAASKAGSRCQ